MLTALVVGIVELSIEENVVAISVITGPEPIRIESDLRSKLNVLVPVKKL